MVHSVCAPGGTSPGLAASSWGLVRPDRRAAPLAVELDSGQEPDSGQELLALNVGSLYFMKQNGKVRGARGVKTDARSTAAGNLKAARRHGALGVVWQPGRAQHLGAWRCERDPLHALPVSPRLAAAAPNRCAAGCRTARWRRRGGAAARALPPRP